MGVRVGIVTSGKAGPGKIEVWPDRPRDAVTPSDVVFSPPASLQEIADRASVIFLVLPEDELRAALTALRGRLGPGATVVSTSPVVPLKLLRSLVGQGPVLFRAVLPPGCEPGEGIAALAGEPGSMAHLADAVKESLEWIGDIEVVSEETLDAVAALTLGGASGLCLALEGMEAGAVAAGLPRSTARSFAHRTALATTLLLCDHPGSPADLKDQVASPGGTTIVALATLEDAGVRGAYLRAVQRSAAKVRQRRDAAASSVIE